MPNTDGLSRKALISLFVVTLTLYVATAMATDAVDMLRVMNPILAALSVAVAVAYANIAWSAFRVPMMARSHMLGLGIFFSWGSAAMLRLLSAAVYGLHNPSLMGTDYSTFALYLQTLAAFFHLAAPLAPSANAPIKAFVSAGIYAGLGVLLMFVFIFLRT